MIRYILLLFFLSALLSGCYIRQAYYVSPFNGNTGNYHTIPLQQDSVRSALYGGATYLAGNANDGGTDYFRGFYASLSRSQNLGGFQAYYGGNLTLGRYFVGAWNETANAGSLFTSASGPPTNASVLNQYTGGYSFGGVGFDGGMNVSITEGRHEWRAIGIETSLRHEWGSYLQFRKSLPDSAATLDIKNNFFGSVGLTSEVLGKTRQGQFGFKWAGGWILGSDYNQTGIHDNASGNALTFWYYAFTFHFTQTRYTGYLQVDRCPKANALQIGFEYRLTR